MRRLGPVHANIETATKAGEFITIARMLCAARGDVNQAHAMAEHLRHSPRVVAALTTGLRAGITQKSSVAAGGFESGNWAEQLGDFGNMITAFLDSLRNYGAFDGMLPSMKRVPLRTRLVLVSLGATATLVPGGGVTPISSLTLTGDKQISEHKAVAILAMSDELARFAGAGGNDLFGRELRAAVAHVTDEQFIALITDGITPIMTNGGTAIGVLQDLAAAFAAIETDAASQLFILVEPDTAKAWATKTTNDGALAFPGMGPKGGEIANTPVLVTDGLVTGTIVVADANQIAAAAGAVELSASKQADIQLDTAPDSPPSAATILHSLWQHNNVALKALRFFGAHRLGADAVAVIEGVGYSGNSPE